MIAAESAIQSAIELSDCSKRFRGTTAVNRLTLVIPQGITFGLIGPNGAGKSTTIRMLMGMLGPTDGAVRVMGADPCDQGEWVKQRVGYVPETPCIYPWMRVDRVLGFAKSAFEKWDDALCRDLLGRFDIDRGKKFKHLSKGTKNKLALVVAVAHEPELLILDEPMAGLDAIAREELLEGVLSATAEGGGTVLFSSHSLDDVRRLADRVGILCEGRLLIEDSIDELLAKTKRIRAVLKDGCRPESEPEGLVWQSVERREWHLTVRDYSPQFVDGLKERYPLETVEVSDVSLEELFKDYVRGQGSTS